MTGDISRRDRKKQETRQRLLEAALRLFRKHGYEATTVEQITQAAAVAKGTFFNYFESKEAILPALVEWRLAQLEDALLPEQGAPASPVARIKLALRLVATDPLADRRLARPLFAAMARQDHTPDHPPAQALTDLLIEQVRQAQAVGEIRADLDPACIACVIRAAVFQQTVMWHCGYRTTPLSELPERTIDMLMDGIAGPQWEKT